MGDIRPCFTRVIKVHKQRAPPVCLVSPLQALGHGGEVSQHLEVSQMTTTLSGQRSNSFETVYLVCAREEPLFKQRDLSRTLEYSNLSGSSNEGPS